MKSLPSFVAILLLARMLLAQTQPSREKVIEQGFLKLGEAQQMTLAPGTVHVWGLMMKKGQYAALEIVEKSINVVVRIVNPKGTLRRELNKPTQVWGIVKTTWIVESTGIWKIEILPSEAIKRGDYEIKLTALREATKRHQEIVEADSLSHLAAFYKTQNNYKEVESLIKRSLIIRERILGPNHLDVIENLNDLAELYMIIGNYTNAEPLCKRSLATLEKTLGPEHPNVATALNNLAVLYYEEGKYAEAVLFLQRALIIDEKRLKPDHPDLAASLDNLAILYKTLGNYAEAESFHKRSLVIRERAVGPDHPDVATSLNNLALLYEDQGKYSEAELLHKRSLTIREKILGPEHIDVATSLDNLAGLYRTQGRDAEAEQLYKRSITISENALGPDHPDLATSLNNLAALYRVESKFAEADSLIKRCLVIWEKSLGPNHPNVAAGLNNLALTYSVKGKYAEAESLYKHSLAIREKALGLDHPDVTNSLNNLVLTMFLKDKDIETTLPLIERSIRILDATIAYPDRRVHAYTLRSQLRKQKEDLDGALSDLIQALQATEKLRPQIGGGEETRAGFFERYSDHFNRMVAWQLEAGQIEKALEYAERGRARVLLDQLATSNIDLRSSILVDTRVLLEQREADAKALMAEYQQRIKLLPSRIDLSKEQKSREIAALKDSLRIVERDYQQVYDEIKAASPLWREVITSSGQPVNLATVQSRLVPAKGMILLYQIGKEESFLFAIPPSGEKTEVLPLEVSGKIAFTLGIKTGPLKSDDLKKILVGKDANDGLLEHLKNSEIGRPKAVFAKLQALCQVLVPAPLWSRLVGGDEVVIVPDGVLHLLPFEALVVRSDITPNATRYWLDEGPVIRYVPSLTTLYNLERRPSVPITPSANQAVILSLADPIFDPKLVAEAMRRQGTDKLATSRSSAATQLSELDSLLMSAVARAGFERSGNLKQLPGTAREAEAIRQAFGEGAVLTLMQLEANEPKLRANLLDKRYLHLATHGIVDEQRGALFAALALTPPPQQTLAAEDDGFLQLHEIYDLKLPACELAVLSACETNFGRYFEGEGIFALSRGFLVAGARRVIASHWAADDSLTAELMGAFFRQIAMAVKARQVVDYARCLRDAKLDVRRKAGWEATHFWAPFIIVGKK